MEISSDHAGAVRVGEGLDVVRLGPFLREHFGYEGTVSVEQFLSGHSNLTYLVRLGTREVVLRRPPFGSKVSNDYKYDDIVLNPADVTEIVGVLDWEMCTVRDPLTDLGTALAYWTDSSDPKELQETSTAPTTLPGTLTRAQLADRYSAVTGHDTGDMVFYLAFARFKEAVIIQQNLFPLRPGTNAGGALCWYASEDPRAGARLMAVRRKRQNMSTKAKNTASFSMVSINARYQSRPMT